MGKEQLTHRLLCMLGGVNARRLRTGFLGKDEFPKVQRGAEILKPLPISIDDTTSITLLELRSKARRHFAHHDISLVIVDYLQLMTSGRRAESRQTEIAEISRGLKALARELGVPVIALSQLNREAEKDDVGEPKLSNLRESGAIEQDADVVMLLWRPNAQPEESSNEIKITVAKHRNGPTGTIKLNFFKEMQRFTNLEEGIKEPDDMPPSSRQDFDEEDLSDGGDGLPDGGDDVPF
jgi:replicative DNA helicase